MEKISEQNMEILKRATDKAILDILRLYNLPFFDKTNYEENKDTLKFVILDESNGKVFPNNSIAMYIMEYNTLYLNETLLHGELLDEEQLRMIILHELVHMASSDRKKKKTGFVHKAFPITYNEGCDQFITLLLLYGDKLEEMISKNPNYTESTMYVKQMVDKLGAEKVFNGFFEADPRKAVDGLNPKELDQFTEIMIAISNSLEAKMAQENAKELSDNIGAVLK